MCKIPRGSNLQLERRGLVYGATYRAKIAENLKAHVPRGGAGAGSPTSPPLIDAPGLSLSNNGGLFFWNPLCVKPSRSVFRGPTTAPQLIWTPSSPMMSQMRL
jgi:hypothetical protein